MPTLVVSCGLTSYHIDILNTKKEYKFDLLINKEQKPGQHIKRQRNGTRNFVSKYK